MNDLDPSMSKHGNKSEFVATRYFPNMQPQFVSPAIRVHFETTSKTALSFLDNT